jgi:hypothetical protein
VAFSPDGKHVISRNRSGREFAWDASGAGHLHEQFQTRMFAHTVSDARSFGFGKGPIINLPRGDTVFLSWDEESG